MQDTPGMTHRDSSGRDARSGILGSPSPGSPIAGIGGPDHRGPDHRGPHPAGGSATRLLAPQGWGFRLDPDLTDGPALFLPILGKPWLVHVIETLATMGHRELELVGAAAVPEILDEIGDGARWGLRITYPDTDSAEGKAKLDAAPPLDPFRLPGSGAPMILSDWRRFAAFSQPKLTDRRPDLMIDGRPVEPGVIIARNVEIHPSARIVSPVYLGRDVRIGRNVTVGPNAVLHAGCLVSRDTEIRRAIVLPGTYLGEDLAVVEMIVCPRGMLSLETMTPVPIPDPFLIGDLRHRTSRLERWLGMLLRAAREAH